ncbi:MAG: DNA polymerase III subunit alpha, partial [Pseudomonadota bacterium]|nr:DNA polymerase III subunit alpha [Pseudomonadota bacterium]
DQPVEVVLRRQTEQGLSGRLGVERLLDDEDRETVDPNYVVRMNLELDVINEMGFPGYFLIVADFIRWAREHRIPVGPGRGSGAGSVVAWALGITELDPLELGLLFERFLNPERVSLPDFDIDFCMEGRDRVIEYVAERYGREQVAQIITFGTMAARAVVRDVGRVMGLSYGFVDTVAKLIPFEIGMTLEKALAQEELLRERYEQEPEIAELIDTAKSLEGLARNVGKHAGGVVIAPQPLTEFTPLYAESAQSQAVTQFDKDDLEAVGLVKFDFLGLRTLTIIDRAIKLINTEREQADEPLLEIEALPLDDALTFDMIKAGRTTALFQMESRGMKEWIVKLLPDSFGDLVALVALYRPGPLGSGMVLDFVNRKHGREQIHYPHPDLEPILKETYGVILYQEQVMQIAQVLAGYSLGGADLLRRAMGKKKPEEMAKQRAIFMAGAAERTVEAATAEYIFDLMEKFAGYGFNKSHSAAYALIAYQTAWLKAHYPAAFMAASMSSDMEHTDKIVVLITECRELGLTVLPPDINRCRYDFVPLDEKSILYGLGAVKGVGQAAIGSIVEERERHGSFKDLFDLCARIDGHKANKRVIEALIKSGAMDRLGEHRAGLLAEMPVAMVAAGQQQSNAASGQADLFGIHDAPVQRPSTAAVAEWSDAQRLTAEKETLGLYLTGHPLDSYAGELSSLVDHGLESKALKPNQGGVVAGLIVGLRVLNTKRGDRMAFITLDDGRSRMEISVFADLYSRYRELLRKDNIVVAQGELSADEFTGGCQMRVETLHDIDRLREQFLRRIEFTVSAPDLDDGLLERLQKALQSHRGGNVEIIVQYTTAGGETGALRIGEQWKVRPEETLIEELRQSFGAGNMRFVYDVQAVRSRPENAGGNQRRFAKKNQARSGVTLH